MTDMKIHKTFLFIIVFLFVSAASVFGCVCAGTPSVAEEFKSSSTVFSGKLVATEYRKGIPDEFRRIQEETEGKKVDYEVLVLKFQVERRWKGSPTTKVIILTGQSREPDGSYTVSDCDFQFEVGKNYLVYAYGAENELRTGVYKNRRTEKGKKRFKAAR